MHNGSTVGGIANMIMKNLTKIIELGMGIVSSIGNAIIEYLPMNIDSAVSIAFYQCFAPTISVSASLHATISAKAELLRLL